MDSRSPRYLLVRDQLAAELAEGRWAPGSVLPGETELALRYGVSRVTVRRALALLKTQGVIDSRQGYGWFVGRTTLRQSLDALVTIEDQIAAAGSRPTRRLLGFTFRTAPGHVSELLGDGSLLEVSRVNFADDQPVGRNTAWVAEHLARGLSMEAVERESLHRLLPVAIASATQTISAEAATAEDAELLQVPQGAPLLRFNRVTRDAQGHAVIYSEAVYNPERTDFTLHIDAR